MPRLTTHPGYTLAKACAYNQGVLVLAVFVQDGVPALACR